MRGIITISERLPGRHTGADERLRHSPFLRAMAWEGHPGLSPQAGTPISPLASAASETSALGPTGQLSRRPAWPPA